MCLSMKCWGGDGGGGGIRTHDDADERRTLSEHGYGGFDMK